MSEDIPALKAENERRLNELRDSLRATFDEKLAAKLTELQRALLERAEHAEALVAEEVDHVRKLEAACDKLQARVAKLEAALSRMLSAGTMAKVQAAQDNARTVLAKGATTESEEP